MTHAFLPFYDLLKLICIASLSSFEQASAWFELVAELYAKIESIFAKLR